LTDDCGARRTLLGLRLVSTPAPTQWVIEPCLPADWPACSISYRYRQTTYAAQFIRGAADRNGPALFLNEQPLPGRAVPLVDDGRPHRVVVQLPAAGTGRAAEVSAVAAGHPRAPASGRDGKTLMAADIGRPRHLPL